MSRHSPTWFTTNARTSLYGLVARGWQRVWFLQGHSGWPSVGVSTAAAATNTNKHTCNIFKNRGQSSDSFVMWRIKLRMRARIASIVRSSILVIGRQCIIKPATPRGRGFIIHNARAYHATSDIIISCTWLVRLSGCQGDEECKQNGQWPYIYISPVYTYKLA